MHASVLARITILAYAYKVTNIEEIVRQLEEYKRALDSAIDALHRREGAERAGGSLGSEDSGNVEGRHPRKT